MSALNADPAGPSRVPAQQGRSGGGVAASGLDWTIFRAVGDLRPRGPLPQPVRDARALSAGDGARRARRRGSSRCTSAMSRIASRARSPTTRRSGSAIRSAGPDVYTLRELVAFVGKLTGHERPIVALGPRLGRLQARVLELLPGTPMSRDNLASMEVDSVCGCAFPAVFGIAPTALAASRRPISGPPRHEAATTPIGRRSGADAMARTDARRADREDLSRRRLGPRRAPGPARRRPRLGRRRRDARDADRVGLPAGRPRFSRLPASRDARGVRARAHRAQARARLSRLRVLRLARRDARTGSRAPRPHDQRDGARRGRHADRSVRRRGATCARGTLRHVSPAFAEDPLRVLRVARFAARFDFVVAPETEALLRALVGVGRARDARAGARLAGARDRPDGAAPVADARGAARVRRARAIAARGRCALRRAAARPRPSGDRYRRASRARARLRGGEGVRAARPLRRARARSRQGSDAAPRVAGPRGARGAQRPSRRTDVGAAARSRSTAATRDGSWRAGTASSMPRASRRPRRCSTC